MDNLAQDKINTFFKQYKVQKFKKDEVIIQPDQEPLGVFYLIEGIVKMYAISANGEELIINTFKPHSFFPMSWVLNNELSHHYFEAKTNVIVIRAPKEDFVNFLETESTIVMDLLKRIYKGLNGYFQRMEHLMGGSAKNRLITELLIHAKRFGEKGDSNVITSLKLTEKELASQSGIARETVSRELQKLKDKKLIAIESKLMTIYDIKKLENELAV